MYWTLIPATIFLLWTTTAEANVTKAANYRLPTKVYPSYYTLDLTIDPENSTYHGFVEITIVTINRTNAVQLHAAPKYLNLTKPIALLDYESSCNITSSNDETEIITVTCHKNAFTKNHTLTLDFNGTFSVDDMYGIYKSTYEENGVKNVLVATQFEPTFARRMLPCFDEPSFKAQFELFITHPTNYTVLSNTVAVESLVIGPNQLQTRFKKTPTMSTYLLALIVSKFEANDNVQVKKAYDYKVYARPSAKKFMDIATTYGSQLIDVMSNFTGIAYETLGDTQAYQVAIPDFAAGAMENWGLITYREVDLLDEGSNTSASTKQRIITTIAHELSHQWFGDYVTLDWWSDTWLNEGFATYFEFHNPDLLKDESFELGNQFVIDVVQDVLQNDALPSSLPLSSPEAEINTLAEDNSKFDDISYSKGGSIVRMIRGIIGDQRFKDGLKSYLTKYQYKNTNPSDLFDELKATNASAEYDIAEIMENWIYEAGYPLVSARLNESGVVILTQERFTTVQNSTMDKTQWYVPIGYTTSDEKDFSIRIKTVMEPNSTTEIEINEGSWIILNVQQTGFYRVNYDDTLWDRIIKALKDDSQKEEIHVLNRAQLIDDVFNIARVGKIDYDTVFDLAMYLSKETEYYPWASALNAIGYLSGKLGDEEAEGLLKNVTLQWINTAFVNATNPSKHIDYIKNSLIMDWACKLGQEDCIDYASQTFENFKFSRSLPDYNKRGIVFCYGLQNSKDPKGDYEFLFNVFKNSTSSAEQNVILSSLGCVSDSSVLSTYLAETISEKSAIRKQDAASVFSAIYTRSDQGVTIALKFLEDNMDKIADRYKGMSALSTIITGIADKLTTDDEVSRLKKIISDHKDIEEIQIVGQQAIDVTTANRAWTKTYGGQVKTVLLAMQGNVANVPKPNVILSITLSIAAVYLFYFK